VFFSVLGVSAWNVGTADVDNDGTVEIITVGCMYTGIMCDPDLRVWSLPSTAEPTAFPYLPVPAIGIAATAVVGTTVALMLIKKRRR
jgi:hypothetical protein